MCKSPQDTLYTLIITSFNRSLFLVSSLKYYARFDGKIIRSHTLTRVSRSQSVTIIGLLDRKFDTTNEIIILNVTRNSL